MIAAQTRPRLSGSRENRYTPIGASPEGMLFQAAGAALKVRQAPMISPAGHNR
jgi:hypothetical protein